MFALDEGWIILKELDRSINFAKQADLKSKQSVLRDIRQVLKSEIDNTIDLIGIGTDAPDLLKAYKKLNKDFSRLKEAETFVKNRVSSEGNNLFSLTDNMLGGGTMVAGAIAGGGVGAATGLVLGAGVNWAKRHYGDEIAAKILTNTAKYLQQEQSAINKLNFLSSAVKKVPKPSTAVTVKCLFKDS